MTQIADGRWYRNLNLTFTLIQTSQMARLIVIGWWLPDPLKNLNVNCPFRSHSAELEKKCCQWSMKQKGMHHPIKSSYVLFGQFWLLQISYGWGFSYFLFLLPCLLDCIFQMDECSEEEKMKMGHVPEVQLWGGPGDWFLVKKIPTGGEAVSNKEMACGLLDIVPLWLWIHLKGVNGKLWFVSPTFSIIWV